MSCFIGESGDNVHVGGEKKFPVGCKGEILTHYYSNVYILSTELNGHNRTIQSIGLKLTFF